MRRLKRMGLEHVKVEGALLPADFLNHLNNGDKRIDGLKPENYDLAATERINEEVSRSWNRLIGLWTAFKDKREKLDKENKDRVRHDVKLTRSLWLLPLFNVLDYGKLATAQPFVMEDSEKEYPISHIHGHVPIHLLGVGVPLDRRSKGVKGASAATPHSLVQEFLNRSEPHLWAFLSNGLKLRILRDNNSLTRQAYIEFDLEGIMENESYAEFTLLWMVCHQSRIAGDKPADCYLEKWYRWARDAGIRILDNLRSGVEEAIKQLGGGFLKCRQNEALREKLKKGTLTTADYYRQLLRLVYRLIFLAVTESRDQLMVPGAEKAAVERYRRFYSFARLRELADAVKGTHHVDLWRGLRLVFQWLDRDEGCGPLGLPGLGGFLWSEAAAADVIHCDIANRELLRAVRSLSFVVADGVLHAVDYRNLGPEELGSVYESLLELHPSVNLSEGTFDLETAGGSERKTTGSYYTPTPLIVSLLDSALEPVLRQRHTVEEILAVKVCDPACGSGHFLLAAAHRIARRLAAVESGDDEPSPEAMRHALRRVAARCIYGVDINAMAVELCKVGLWMEALEPGTPLAFLDHHIRCGNSLVGAFPALMEKGIPDAAFTPIEGDDKKICAKYKNLNRKGRGEMGARYLFDGAGEALKAGPALDLGFARLDAADDRTMADRKRKEAEYRRLTGSDEYRELKLAADTWCAAFVWIKKETKEMPFLPDSEVYQNMVKNRQGLQPWMEAEVGRLAEEYGFFHFHLAFPEVFPLPGVSEKADNEHTGWNGGFDVVLGNPPWERVKLQEKEFFAVRQPDIAGAANAAARRKMIENLIKEGTDEYDPELYNDFLAARRQAEGVSHILRNSGKFPLCGRGDVNTYTVFTELNRSMITQRGRVGCIVPSGIATDDTTKFFFQDLVKTRTLVSLYDFENRKKIFPAVDSRMKFSLLTLSGAGSPMEGGAEFVFFAHSDEDLLDKDRRFTLTSEDIALLNPNTKTCPIFRQKRDAIICKQIIQNVPIWKYTDSSIDKSRWNPKIKRLIDINLNAKMLKTAQELYDEGYDINREGDFENESEKFLRLYEGKMIHIFNHRLADSYTVEKGQRSGRAKHLELNDLKKSERTCESRFWVNEKEILKQIPEWDRKWMFSYMDVCSVTNERTVIASIIPMSAPTFSLRTLAEINGDSDDVACLLANFCSYIFDYYVRQFVGGLHLSDFIMYQMPVLLRAIYRKSCLWDNSQNFMQWIKTRVLKLTYTAWDLEPFARDCGYEGEPFEWDEEERFRLRCELDAAYFHLYGISEGDMDYIMETFPIVRRKDIQTYGTYRTKETILEIYREMRGLMPKQQKPTETHETHITHVTKGESSMTMKIFISYAREDEGAARRLYDALSAMPNVSPWMDTVDLLPGDDWNEAIQRAMEESRLIFILLSHHSVSKDGYIQKEVRKALDLREEKSPTRNFLIPVRIAECDTNHRKLKELQRVDLFNDWPAGLEKIKATIQREQEKDGERKK